MLASDNDSPAAPSTGRALLRRFRFEDLFVCDMGPFSTIPHTQTLVFDLSLFVWKIFFRSALVLSSRQEQESEDQWQAATGKAEARHKIKEGPEPRRNGPDPLNGCNG
jgi:hypothetical protein